MTAIFKNAAILFTFSLIVSCATGKVEQDVTLTRQEPLKNIPKAINVPDQVLVFTKTGGYRHESIEKGVATLRMLGKANNFEIAHTEDSLQFNDKNLERYKLVIFLSTTGNILDDNGQAAFENYMKSGGNYMGVHAAADTEYDWPWYGKLVGAWFLSHPGNPNVREATIDVVDHDHPSTSFLGDTWTRTDEWYNYKNINPAIHVLLNLDETSYEGGANGENHPIAWYHTMDGGRAFYTGGGHTEESYDEPDFQKHLLGGIIYCLGRK